MKLISFATKLLHFFPAEISHHIALNGLNLLYRLGLLKFLVDKNNGSRVETKDMEQIRRVIPSIKNRIGIAAGLDKNGEYIDCLGFLGIGFIEVGTVTPRPQSGNLKPRLFRNTDDNSILNRLGFNNKGVEKLVIKLRKRKSKVIVGVSVGKNFDTPNYLAYKDYSECIEKVYEFSDYLAINISSPNTKDLRELSSRSYLDSLLSRLKEVQMRLSSEHGYKPLFLKISPDESSDTLKEICESILANDIDGIICTNTTTNHNNDNGEGGISGTPLMDRSTEVLCLVRDIIGEKIPLIASGGVMSASDFNKKIESGASLVQIYTGFIFKGPKLIKDILERGTF